MTITTIYHHGVFWKCVLLEVNHPCNSSSSVFSATIAKQWVLCVFWSKKKFLQIHIDFKGEWQT